MPARTRSQQLKPPSEPTLRELWRGLLPGLPDKGAVPMPEWPPDTFALCAHALRHTSAYAAVLDRRRRLRTGGSNQWATETSAASRKWLQAIFGHQPLPARVRELWRTIGEALDRPLSGITRPRARAGRCLLELLAIADQACGPLAGEGDASDGTDSLARAWGSFILRQNNWKTLCRQIHPSRIRVLPKARTPQRGLTMRSVSLFAGLADGTELDSQFTESLQVSDGLTLNLLVLPWPLDVQPSQFRASDPLPEDYGFFAFDQRPADRGFFPAVSELIDEAEHQCGKVSVVVLPELALSEPEAARLRRLLAQRDCGLVAGIGSSGSSARGDCGTNRVQLYMPGVELIDQHKHHRWKLDRAQIIQYSLGNLLHHEKQWWEHIELAGRSLHFLRLMPWLTLCVLICEDLARPDPAGDVVRALGPNLVISLLMDGPQLIGRWASRHAVTLADDPGSSVLTVTSLGMTKLSRPAKGASRERVIALWKEEGEDPVEIDLPSGHHAVVLSISMKGCVDHSADGRSREASIPSLTGVRFLKSPRLAGGG